MREPPVIVPWGRDLVNQCTDLIIRRRSSNSLQRTSNSVHKSSNSECADLELGTEI
jgi:hypothetical protein